MELLLAIANVVLIILVCLFVILGVALAVLVCGAGKNRDRMEELAGMSCKDCIYDVRDEDDPDWKECGTHGHIPDEVFDNYDDNELPQYCGQFIRKE